MEIDSHEEAMDSADRREERRTSVIEDRLQSQPPNPTAVPEEQDTLGASIAAAAAAADTNPQPAPEASMALVRAGASPPDEDHINLLGAKLRAMVDLVNRLRAAGIEAEGLPLPRIAVIGNQSAGKSSLIEAISGIKVPRYSGTCTRCPLEIILKEATSPQQSWSCTVSLRFRKAYHPDRSPPWIEEPQMREVPFMNLTTKEQVEEALIRAQSAVLNPRREWTEFLPQNDGVVGGAQAMGMSKELREKLMKDAQNCEVKFSPNVVLMDITGPGLPNLSFIDLPGIIQTSEKKSERFLVEVVKDLVREYVQEPYCLILLAMTMKDDAVNQSAAEMAREYGPDRTIGALTKPDTVEPGTHDQWMEIIRGRAHKLKHGYFVTKQPNQQAVSMGVDGATARAQEEEFFDTVEPWCGELADCRHRFGTPALARYLAEQLGALIAQRLPALRDQITMQISDTFLKLSKLPPEQTEHPVRHLDRIMNEFEKNVTAALEPKSTAVHYVKMKMHDFAKEIEKLSPRLVVINDHEKEQEEAEKYNNQSGGLFGRNNRRMIEARAAREVTPTPNGGKGGEHGDAMDVDEPAPSTPAGRKRPMMETPKSNKKPRGGDATPSNSSSTPVAIKYTLPHLSHLIKLSNPSHTSGYVDISALESISRASISLWERVLTSLLTSLREILLPTFRDTFTSTFSPYKSTELYKFLLDSLGSTLTQALSLQESRFSHLLATELEYIATLNDDEHARLKSMYLTKLQMRRTRNLEDQKAMRMEKEKERARQLLASGGDYEDGGASAFATPTKGRGRGRQPAAARMPSPEIDSSDIEDQYKIPLEVLANTKAYYDIARKRFADNVYQSVLGELLRICRKEVVAHVRGGLDLDAKDAEERCAKLLEHDPEMEKRRRELKAKMVQFGKAQDELKRFETEHERLRGGGEWF